MVPAGGPPRERTDGGTVALLAEDPDLAAGILEEERRHAERLVVVPVLTVLEGPLDLVSIAEEPHLGFLVLEGFVTVDVLLRDRIASHLAGPGDVLHGADRAAARLPAGVSYSVSETARIAVLDRRFMAAVRRWPELLVALHDRLRAQEQRQAVHAAIGKLRRVEDRVTALLWHLGERWGRVSPAGVVVPLALTHEAIGRLAGAERPTVSLALTALAESGDVARRDDGAFVLDPESWRRLESSPEAATGRPLAVRTAPAAHKREDTAPVTRKVDPLSDREAMHRRIAAMREELPERAHRVEELLATARATAKRSRTTRERLAGERATGRR